MQIQAACVSGAQKVYGMSHDPVAENAAGRQYSLQCMTFKQARGRSNHHSGYAGLQDRPREDDANARAGGLCTGRIAGESHPRQRERLPRVALQTPEASGVVQER